MSERYGIEAFGQGGQLNPRERLFRQKVVVRLRELGEVLAGDDSFGFGMTYGELLSATNDLIVAEMARVRPAPAEGRQP